MNNQAKVTDLAEKRQSMADPQSLSGQFRLADTSNRLKCLFWDAMHNSAGTAADEMETGADPYGILRFPHNGDSPLGTGRIKQHHPTLEFKRPERLAQAN